MHLISILIKTAKTTFEDKFSNSNSMLNFLIQTYFVGYRIFHNYYSGTIEHEKYNCVSFLCLRKVVLIYEFLILAKPVFLYN